MSVLWPAAGAVTGVLAGAVLRGPVFRLSVPSGEPERAACPHCAAPAERWFLGRCTHCGGVLGIPAALELASAAVLAVLLGRFGGQPDTVALGFLGVLGVALAAIDIAVQRLPDRLVLPAYPVLLILLTGPAMIEQSGAALIRSLLAGVALAAGYLGLALVRPGSLGGGDIKLAGLTGLAMGWLGWHTVLVGSLLAFALSAIASVALLATRRITLHSHLAFGPFLLAGALLAIVAAG